MVTDDTKDGVTYLPFRCTLLRVVRHAEICAQHVDAGLAERSCRGVIRKSSQGIDAAEPDGGGGVPELRDGVAEPFVVETGRVAKCCVLIDALTPVGNDQGHQRTCAGHDTEGDFH
ncbi:hypothetical protein AB4Z54_07355, partial [Streptomyces sp. MCAF7]